MDEGLISAQQAEQVFGNLNKEYAASREKAQTIVSNMAKLHERELAAWNWLQGAMAAMPPDATEEAALWELFCRVRRERY